MDRRLIVGILLLTLAWQGPALAYSASLTPVGAASGVIHCAGANSCDGCCSHNAGSCATACALSLSAAVPLTVAPIASTVPQLPVPDANKPALVEPIRPVSYGLQSSNVSLD